MLRQMGSLCVSITTVLWFCQSSAGVDETLGGLVVGCSEQRARIAVGDKWGFIDTKGNVVIRPRFDGAWGYNNGVAPVQVDGKWGCIGKEGGVVIAPAFEHPPEFSEGFAAVRIGNKHGYIDPRGKVVIQPQFEEAGCFSEGLAAVTMGDQRFYIDREGKIAFRAPTTQTGWFHEGLAVFVTEDRTHFGFMDRSGGIAIPATFDYTERDRPRGFSEGLALVSTGNRCGFIDKSGKIVIKPQFAFARDFHDGRALIADVKPATGGPRPKYGYIDTTGRLVIPLQFDSASNFSEGLAGVSRRGEGGYIDKAGTFVIKLAAVRPCGNFSGGLALVCDKGRRVSYIDREGKVVWSPPK
jgi:hypothetical protein